jgi:hypothetical protein
MSMKTEQYIRAIAGSFVLISLALGYVHHPYWHLFTAFVGLNLLQSAFTKWCLMEDILNQLGVSRTLIDRKQNEKQG